MRRTSVWKPQNTEGKRLLELWQSNYKTMTIKKEGNRIPIVIQVKSDGSGNLFRSPDGHVTFWVLKIESHRFRDPYRKTYTMSDRYENELIWQYVSHTE